MSGLGEALESGGVSGTAENVPTQDAQTIQSNPKEIKHTSAIETIMFLLLRDWIFHSRYQINTSMNPGHVFGIIKVHPMFSHKYVRYVYQMFNAWTGSMAVRCRFMGTAFYGGSFRIGFLPPNVSEADIRGMGTENLTAYPNVDLDPKNTDWMTYSPPDERNVMFHWATNQPTSDRPETFGGYIVFYVVGPLVTQNPEFNSISLVVEAVGKFDFAQPNPHFGNSIAPPINAGPLSVATCTDLFNQRGCDDFICDRMRVQYLNSTTTSLQVGGIFAKGYNNHYTTTFSPNTIDPNFLAIRTQWENNAIKITTAANCGVDTDKSTFLEMFPFPTTTQRVIMNAEKLAYNSSQALYSLNNLNVWQPTAIAVEKKFNSNNFRVAFNPQNSAVYFADYPAGNSSFLCLALDNEGPISLAACAITANSTSMAPTVANESIVLFTNVYSRSMNIQTLDMRRDLGQTAGLDNSVSHLYAVRTVDDPDPIRIWRLNPNGFFTTSALLADVIFEPQAEVYLTYEGPWPTNNPLPPQSAYSMRYSRELMRNNKEGVYSC